MYQNDSVFQVPVHNFVDDVSWVKGRHTLQFGVNVSLLRNPQANNINSFSQASDNASWFDTAALAATGAPAHFDPGCSKTGFRWTAASGTTMTIRCGARGYGSAGKRTVQLHKMGAVLPMARL